MALEHQLDVYIDEAVEDLMDLFKARGLDTVLDRDMIIKHAMELKAEAKALAARVHSNALKAELIAYFNMTLKNNLVYMALADRKNDLSPKPTKSDKESATPVVSIRLAKEVIH